MSSLRKRVGKLEEAQAQVGGLVVVKMAHDDFTPLTPTEEVQRLEEAQAEAGPNGTVVTIRYVENWREQGDQSAGVRQ